MVSGKSVISEESTMNKARLEWVISGLNQHELTKAEGQFVKTAQEDFNKNQMLTEYQEARLESLYKEKSQLMPSRRQALPKATLKKARPLKPSRKIY